MVIYAQIKMARTKAQNAPNICIGNIQRTVKSILPTTHPKYLPSVHNQKADATALIQIASAFSQLILDLLSHFAIPLLKIP